MKRPATALAKNLIFAFITITVLAGCDSTTTEGTGGQAKAPAAEEQQPESLEQRVKARWDALIERDFEEAYKFNSPEYRKIYTLKDYKGDFGTKVRWTGADVVSTSVEGNSATVRIQIAYKTAMPDGRVVDASRYLSEKWVRKDGNWWYVKD